MINVLTIPIAIVAHPAREDLVEKLVYRATPNEVFWDTGGIGCTANHLRAWKFLARQQKDPWGVVLEDDVLPISNFFAELGKALDNTGAGILSLYLGRGAPVQWQQRIAQAITKDVSYYSADELLSTQGYAIRPWLLPSLIEYAEPRVNDLTVDRLVSEWTIENGYGVSYCKYSLVDHIDGPTLVADHGDGRERNGKTALITTDSDGGEDLPEIRKAWLMARGDVDWTKGYIDL